MHEIKRLQVRRLEKAVSLCGPALFEFLSESEFHLYGALSASKPVC